MRTAGHPLGEYARRFATTPTKYLDDARYAAAEYHKGLTVAKTFAPATYKAAHRHDLPGKATLDCLQRRAFDTGHADEPIDRGRQVAAVDARLPGPFHLAAAGDDRAVAT